MGDKMSSSRRNKIFNSNVGNSGNSTSRTPTNSNQLRVLFDNNEINKEQKIEIANVKRLMKSELNIIVSLANSLLSSYGDPNMVHYTTGESLLSHRRRLLECIVLFLRRREDLLFQYGGKAAQKVPSIPEKIKFSRLVVLFKLMQNIMPYNGYKCCNPSVTANNQLQMWVLTAPYKDPQRVVHVLHTMADHIIRLEKILSENIDLIQTAQNIEQMKWQLSFIDDENTEMLYFNIQEMVEDYKEIHAWISELQHNSDSL